MIDLRITIDEQDHAQLKHRLLLSSPETKSSHRAEALARGLGFTRNATLLNALSRRRCEVSVDGTRFRDYLEERDLAIDVINLYRAAAYVAVARVMECHPTLSSWGPYVGRPRIRDDGRRETSEQLYARFLRERDRLVTVEGLDEFLIALSFVQQVPTTRTIRDGSGSYRLKHIAERSQCTFPCGYVLGSKYVSNGALIAAALHANFRTKTHRDDLGYEAVSVTFNMSKAAIDELDRKLRPNGALAQGRRRLAEKHWF